MNRLAGIGAILLGFETVESMKAPIVRAHHIMHPMNAKDARKRNIRDLSYLKRKDGYQLAEGFFFRSGRLRKFSRKGVKELKAANLRTVIDLRTEGENIKKPDKLWDGLEYHLIPLVKSETLGITHERGLKAYKKPPVMTELYANIIADETSISALREVFTILFDPKREGAVLWHCTAGKDRCGIVSAIFLLALGYAEESVFEDYLLSDAESEKKGRLYRFLVRYLLWKKELAEGVYEAMRARREYLASALATLRELYGSVHDFLLIKVGITQEQINLFLDRYKKA